MAALAAEALAVTLAEGEEVPQLMQVAVGARLLVIARDVALAVLAPAAAL